LNRKALQGSLLGRIFYGEPASIPAFAGTGPAGKCSSRLLKNRRFA
jgi:hypothetical protein